MVLIMKTNLTVIILTYNEKLHIQRCLENVKLLNPEQIYVVDSPSNDGTQEIAQACGATVVVHPYPGNQAAQFNWALDHLPIQTEWILRLDADEYLMQETIEEIKVALQSVPKEVSYFSMLRKVYFAGARINHGGSVC